MLVELTLDRLDSHLGAIARGDEVRLRVDGNLVESSNHLPGQRIEPRELADLVAEETDTQRMLFMEA